MSLDNPLQSLITLTVTHTCLNGTSCIWFCSHSFLFIHWIPVRIPIWLCVIYSLSHQLFIDIDKIPLNLLLPSLSSPSFLSLLLCNRCSIPWALWPFDGLIPVCQFLFLHRGTQNWAQHSSWLSPVLRGRLSSPDLLLMLLPKADFAVRAHYWLMVTLASARTPWFFSTKLLYSLLFLNMVHRDIPPYEQSWDFPLVRINYIPVCSFLQTVRIPSEWWNNHLVSQLLLPVLCHLQVCRCHAQVQRCSLMLENITFTSTAENLGAGSGACPDLNQEYSSI